MSAGMDSGSCTPEVGSVGKEHDACLEPPLSEPPPEKPHTTGGAGDILPVGLPLPEERRAAPFLTPAAWILAGLYAVFAVAMAGDPPPVGTLMLGLSLATAVAMSGIAVAARRTSSGEVRGALMVGVAGLVVLNSIIRLGISGDPVQSTNLGLLLIGVGATMGIRAFVSFAGLVWVSWLVLLPGAGLAGAWEHYGFFLFSSTALGVILLVGRSRYTLRLDRAAEVEEELTRDLSQSLAWYRKLFHDSPALMCLHDSSGRIEEVNPAALRALGLPRQEVVGRNILDFMVPYTEEGPGEYLRDVQEERGAEGWTRVRTGDGRILVWEYRSTTLGAGPNAQVLGTAVDVTELNRARDGLAALVDVLEDRVAERTDALTQANSRYRTVLATLPDMVATLDPDGMVLSVETDPAGSPLDLRPGVRLADLLERGGGVRLRDHLAEVAAGRSGSSLDLLLEGADGPVWVQLRLAALGEGEILAVLRDVTRDRWAEQERRTMSERILQAQKLDSLGVLAGGVAHEFNNLLAVVQGYLELHLDELPNAVRRDLESALDATDRAGALVHQILSFSQPDPGHAETLPVATILSRVGEVLQPSVPPGVRLVVEAPDPELQVTGVAGKLVQAVLNAALNGAQAMEGKAGALTLSAHPLEVDAARPVNRGWMAPGRYVCVLVQDEGVGIAPEIQARLFEPFFTTREVGQGTGLGLAIARGVVAAHGGHMSVESTPGEGTEVRICLPLAQEERPRAREGVRGSVLTYAREPGRAVLLLEDDRHAGRRLEEALVEAGYDVFRFQSPHAALEGIRNGVVRADVILADLTLPEMSGLEFLAQLRRVVTGVPAVVLGRAVLESGEAKRLEVEAVLGKPVSVARLTLELDRILQRLETAGGNGPG